MHRIWNCLTRGFRARPPASPSQTSSQCNDDNDTLQPSAHESEIHYSQAKQNNSGKKRLVLVPDKQQNAVLFLINDQNQRKDQDDYFKQKIHDNFTEMVDSIVYGAASALVIGQIARYVGNVVYRKARKDEPFSVRLSTLRKRWHRTSSSTCRSSNSVRSILPKVSSVSLPISTAYAAGGAEEISQDTTSNTQQVSKRYQIDFSQDSDVKLFTSEKAKATVRFSCPDVGNCGSNEDKKLLSEDDLARYKSSIEQGIGMTFVVQGKKSFAAGDLSGAFNNFLVGSRYSSEAKFLLAQCYHMGKGTKRDEQQAEREYRLAAREGHTFAQYNLALLLLERGKSKHIAMFYLEKAARKGLVQAQALAGYYFAQRGEYENMKKAVEMFRLAADQEDLLSTYHLAECYEHGLGGLSADAGKAFELYATAADRGHLDAQFKMAMILLNGCPEIEKNEEVGMELLKKAADADHRESVEKYTDLILRPAGQVKTIPRRKNESCPSTTNYIDISHMVIPELLSGLSPLNAMNEPRSDVESSAEQSNSFIGPLLDCRVYGQCMHRVSSWPCSMFHGQTAIHHPCFTK